MSKVETQDEKKFSWVHRTFESEDNPTMKDFLLKVFVPAAIVVFAVNILFGGDYKNSTSEVAARASSNGDYEYAFQLYYELIDSNFYNPSYHRDLLKTQFHLRNSDRGFYRDPFIFEQYSLYAEDPDPRTSDIGHYGLGIYYILREEYIAALRQYNTVQNRDMPYLNNSIGIAFLAINKVDIAKHFFKREIELNGFVKGACINLCYLYQREGNLAGIYKLAKDPRTKGYIPKDLTDAALVHEKHLFQYFLEQFSYEGITLSGFIAATIIMILWLAYLLRLDTAGPASTLWLLTTLVLGMLFAEMCTIFYDLVYHGLGLHLGQSPLRDLLYCILAVGLIEESMKIIPFLLILKLSGQIKRPIDYIIYASVSALGFAFLENLNYFKDPGLSIISARTLSAVLLHMSLTTFAVYGLVYAKFKKNNVNKLAWFAGSFFTAVFVHGLYDFWLSAKWLNSAFTLISIIILIMATVEFGTVIKKSLTMNGNGGKRVANHTRYLIYSLSAVFLSQHFIMGWKLGAEAANLASVKSFVVFYVLSIIIVKVLGDSNTPQVEKVER